MQVTLSREILTSKQTQGTMVEEFTMESDFEVLEHYESSKWEAYEEEIRIIEQSVNIVSTQQIHKIIQKEGITLNINGEIAILEFQNIQPSTLESQKIQQVYEKVKAQFYQETQTIRLTLTQKQSELKILLSDLNSKSLEIGQLNAAHKLSEDQFRRDILRFQNQNRLLNQQINRLKYDLSVSVSVKSSTKLTVISSQQRSLATQTDFENPQILVPPIRPGVQIIKPNSNRKQYRQIGISPMIFQLDSPNIITTPRSNKSFKIEEDDSFMEENKYLRDLVHKFSEQLEQSKKKITESPSESRLTTINSSDVVILRNRISELESRNRTLQNQKQRLRGQIIIKQSHIRNLQIQLKTSSPVTKVTGFFKKQKQQTFSEYSTSSRVEESGSKRTRDLEAMSNNLLKLQNQIRDLQRKLDDEKRDKASQIQKYQLEISRISNDLKYLNDQKSNIQKQLTSVKSVASFDNYSKEDSQRRIKELQIQVESLRSERNNTSNRYVSSSSYEFLKQQHEKEKKSMNQAREKSRLQITTITTNYNKVVQQHNQTKNQKQRVQGQLSRLQVQKTRLDTEIQRFRVEIQTLTKKLRIQETTIHSSSSIKSLNQTQHVTRLTRENQILNEELRKIKQQSQKFKQLITEYKQILNNRNLTVLNDKLHTYEVQIKEKNIYINTLETNLASKEERIKYLENLRSKVTTPRNESKFDWVNINGELEYEQKMTEKLSEHIKQLKIENQNLEQELGDKENIIMILNQRLAELSNPNRFNRGTMFDQIESRYNELLSKTKDRTNRLNASSQIQQLLAEIENYKNKYEKALETSNYLRECIYEVKRTTNVTSCGICSEYQEIVSELQRRINIFEVMMMSELRRMFVNCDSRLNETGFSWVDLENVIYDLRTRTLNHRGYDTYSEERSIKYMEDSPIALQRIFEKSRRTPTKSERRLDELIKYDALNQEAITTLLLRITEAALLDKPKFILPDYVYILYLDTASPSKMKVELVEIKELIGEEHKQYQSPEVLNGGQHNSKSLVWNLGIIFNLVINRKAYFKDEKEILDNKKTYRYENRSMPNFKYILESMLEREPNRRSTLQKVLELLKVEQQALKE